MFDTSLDDGLVDPASVNSSLQQHLHKTKAQLTSKYPRLFHVLFRSYSGLVYHDNCNPLSMNF